MKFRNLGRSHLNCKEKSPSIDVSQACFPPLLILWGSRIFRPEPNFALRVLGPLNCKENPAWIDVSQACLSATFNFMRFLDFPENWQFSDLDLILHCGTLGL